VKRTRATSWEPGRIASATRAGSTCPPGSGVARADGGWQHNSVDYVLAQVNVARLRAPLDSPLLADFVAGLDPVNATADAEPGFIWRLQTEDGNATSVRAFEWDAAGSAGVLVNMSVWESVQALAGFVYSGVHRQVLRRRRRWFEPMAEAYTALWWIPRGHVPTTCASSARRRTPSRSGSTFRRPARSPAGRCPARRSGPAQPDPGGSRSADQADMAGPASISWSPAWFPACPAGGVFRLYSGPRRNRIAAMIEPAARMPAVHQNAVS
jgi:Domain of unknown function (DUF3291)